MSLLFVYHFNPDFPYWGYIYLHILTIGAFLWCVVRIIFKPKKEVLLPSGFEVLLLAIAWFVPVVVASILTFTASQKVQLFWACFQAIPAISVIKLSMANQAKKSRWMVLPCLFLWVFKPLLFDCMQI